MFEPNGEYGFGLVEADLTEADQADDKLPEVSVSGVFQAFDLELFASVDGEAVDYLNDSGVGKLWKLVYGAGFIADDIAVKAESFVWEGYAQQVRDRFLAEYSAAKELPIPAGYDFRPNKKDLAQPLLMQRHALNWTRLSCYKFVAHQVRLWLFVLAYNLGNFMRRLVLPGDMKHWTLTSLQTRLIKTGGRLVLHARRLVFQLAEVLVTREMLTGILEPISWLRLAPG